jgi:hypothetical protein
MARQTGGSMAATQFIQNGGTNVDGKSAATETGTFLGKFQYVRFGSGPENLVLDSLLKYAFAPAKEGHRPLT